MILPAAAPFADTTVPYPAPQLIPLGCNNKKCRRFGERWCQNTVCQSCHCHCWIHVHDSVAFHSPLLGKPFASSSSLLTPFPLLHLRPPAIPPSSPPPLLSIPPALCLAPFSHPVFNHDAHFSSILVEGAPHPDPGPCRGHLLFYCRAVRLHGLSHSIQVCHKGRM